MFFFRMEEAEKSAEKRSEKLETRPKESFYVVCVSINIKQLHFGAQRR